MASLRDRKIAYLKRAGFHSSEARELSHVTKAGFYAPYFQKMIRDRRGLLMNAIRYNWSREKYWDEVRQRYIDRGFVRYDALGRTFVDVWKLLRWYEERYPAPDEYESPWRKTIEKRRGRKKVLRRITRKATLQHWIADLDRNIERARSEARVKRLREQRGNLETRLRQIEREEQKG